ncbi:hypothetical protein EJB05_27129, partial [Eragrostis curvula]
MDGFGASDLGGDGTRDLFPNPDPFSHTQAVLGDDGNPVQPGNIGGCRIDLGRLDLNSDVFPPPGGFDGIQDLCGPYAMGGGSSSGYGGPGGHAFGGPSAPAIGPQVGPLGLGYGGGVGGEGGGVHGGLHAARRRGSGGARAVAARRGGGPAGGSVRGRVAGRVGPPARGRGGRARGRGAGLLRGVPEYEEEPDDFDSAEDDDFVLPWWTDRECPRSHWDDEKTEILLDIVLEAKDLGLFVKGSMKPRGYAYLKVKFYERTHIKQRTQQFRNRLGQLKVMLWICQRLQNKTGRGALPNGWPKASRKWWRTTLQGKNNAELRNLMYRGPPYYEKLKQAFAGAVVDGASAYYAGDESGDDGESDDAEEEEDDEEEQAEPEEQEDEDYVPPAGFAVRSPQGSPYGCSPPTSGSRKRGSSTNTTGASPSKRSTRSPMVQAVTKMTDTQDKQQQAKLEFLREQNQEQMAFMREQAQLHMEMERKKIEMRGELEIQREQRHAQKEADQLATLNRMREIAIADGWDTGSLEYLALSYMYYEDGPRTMWLGCTTPEARLKFIRGYIKLNKG